MPEIFDESILNDLVPDFSYWEKRGIPTSISSLFKGGLCLDSQGVLGKMKKCQILVIYNHKKDRFH